MVSKSIRFFLSKTSLFLFISKSLLNTVFFNHFLKCCINKILQAPLKSLPWGQRLPTALAIIFGLVFFLKSQVYFCLLGFAVAFRLGFKGELCFQVFALWRYWGAFIGKFGCLWIFIGFGFVKYVMKLLEMYLLLHRDGEIKRRNSNFTLKNGQIYWGLWDVVDLGNLSHFWYWWNIKLLNKFSINLVFCVYLVKLLIFVFVLDCFLNMLLQMDIFWQFDKEQFLSFLRII